MHADDYKHGENKNRKIGPSIPRIFTKCNVIEYSHVLFLWKGFVGFRVLLYFAIDQFAAQIQKPYYKVGRSTKCWQTVPVFVGNRHTVTSCVCGHHKQVLVTGVVNPTLFYQSSELPHKTVFVIAMAVDKLGHATSIRSLDFESCIIRSVKGNEVLKLFTTTCRTIGAETPTLRN